MAWQDALAVALGRPENQPQTPIDNIDNIDKTPGGSNSVNSVNSVNRPQRFILGSAGPISPEKQGDVFKHWPSEIQQDAKDRAARLQAAGWTEAQARVLAGYVTADRWGLTVPLEIGEESRRLVESATVH